MGKTIGDIGEFGLIEFIRDRLGEQGLVVDVGDDAAVVATNPGDFVVATVDDIVQDVHFTLDYPPRSVGWRAIASSSSDIAAMGGKARFFLISLVAPEETTFSWFRRFLSGATDFARRFNLALVGGNISNGDSIRVSTTTLGTIPPGHIKRRCGAKVGDIIYLTGAIGGSQAGRIIFSETKNPRLRLAKRHLFPVPRLVEGKILGAVSAVSAMIDISDGFLQDLGHILTNSDVGAYIDIDDIPLFPGVDRFCRERGLEPIEFALSSGEEYELIFTAEEKYASGIEEEIGEEKVIPIGEIVAKKGIFAKRGGKLIKLSQAGWRHF